MMKLFCKIIFSFLIFTINSCSNIDVSDANLNSKKKKNNKINLLNCQSEKFEKLIKELPNWMNSMYSNCKQFKVSYKTLSPNQVDELKKSMKWNIHHVYKLMKDSTLLDKTYVYTPLKECSNSIIYNENDSCSFYTGGVLHSEDYTIQFIRLYQTGKKEYMDLMLRFNGDNFEVLAHG